MQTVMENVALRSVIIVLIALSCWHLADLIGEILIQRKKIPPCPLLYIMC